MAGYKALETKKDTAKMAKKVSQIKSEDYQKRSLIY